MSAPSRNWLFLLVVASATPYAARADAVNVSPMPSCGEQSVVPRNVTIQDEYLLSLASEMARRSVKFRQQLLTLGAAPGLRARVRNTGRMESTVVLAKTTFGHNKSGLLVADIQIPVALIFARRDVEYIAHEVEHVIEQVEGVNLKALAGKRGSGVYRVDMAGRPFETERARTAGLIVEREFRQHDGAPEPCGTVDADAGS